VAAAGYDMDGLASAGLMLAPLVCAIAALRLSSHGHWASPLLAAPALLLGAALVAALFRNASGPGVVGALVYAPVLLGLSLASIIRWRRRRRP
jgi:hypothetical protein